MTRTRTAYHVAHKQTRVGYSHSVCCRFLPYPPFHAHTSMCARWCSHTDLVPREAGERWLKYFREELPTVAFKCSTQHQGTGLKQGKMPSAKSLNEGLTVSGEDRKGSGEVGAV